LLYAQIEHELGDQNTRDIWSSRRQAMLQDKIDVTGLFVWLLQDFSARAARLQRDPTVEADFR
jgi:hypothetical protein